MAGPTYSAAYNAKNQEQQGGGNWVVAGNLNIDKTNGGKLYLDGVEQNGTTGVLSAGTVAAAGANQGAATPIATDVVTVTASDDAKGVVLPTATAGRVIVVINTVNAKNLLVYPASGGTIDYGAQDAAYTLAGRKHALFVAVSATQWYAVLTA